MVSQRNQRFDRPPFDLVTPFSQSSRDGWYDAVRRQYATRPPRPSLIHGVPEVDPRALNGRPGTPGLLTPDGLGPSENHTFLPCQGSWQGSRCPDRNLNPYAGTRPVHQAASVTQVRQRRETSPQEHRPPPPGASGPPRSRSAARLRRRLAVRRGVPVLPMTSPHAQPEDRVNVTPAVSTVERVRSLRSTEGSGRS